MFFGFVELEGSAYLWTLTVNGSGVPTAPDAAPTFSVYEGDQDSPQTNGSAVTMTGPVNSQTGFYRKSHSAVSADGYERGKTYAVKINYAISSTNYSLLGYFTVV